MRFFKALLTIVLLIPSIPSISQDAKDYHVYSEILEEFLRFEKPEKDLILIIRESDSTLFPDYATAYPQLMARLESLMKTRIMFDDRFKINGHTSKVITEEEYYSLTFDENHDIIWDPLYKKYPTMEGIINLSPILYASADKTKGVLQIGISRGSLSAGYFFVTFDLTKKRKKRITRRLTLVS